MMFDIVGIGECVVDMTPAGESERGNALFERHPGGAPSNMLACAAKQGLKTALISIVGDDTFGHYLVGVLKDVNIDVRAVHFSENLPTFVALVDYDDRGDRRFFKMQLESSLSGFSPNHLDKELISQAKLVHIAGSMLAWPDSLEATRQAIDFVHEEGKLVSCDVNWREMLYDQEYAQTIAKPILYEMDILKMSEEEMSLYTGTSDLVEGTKILCEAGVKLAAVTLGARGCYYRYKNGSGRLYTYDTKVVDTNASGDTFTAVMLAGLAEYSYDIDSISNDIMYHIMERANAGGAGCAANRGAMYAVPSVEEIDNCMKTVPLLKLD